jgi:hypothetical protein
MTSVASPESTGVMLICEDKEAPGDRASIFLKVDEAGQYSIRKDLHCEIDNPIKCISEGPVLASSGLNETPTVPIR